jgi:hypothetical protein
MFLEPFLEQPDFKDSKPIVLSQSERSNNKVSREKKHNKMQQLDVYH